VNTKRLTKIRSDVRSVHLKFNVHTSRLTWRNTKKLPSSGVTFVELVLLVKAAWFTICGNIKQRESSSAKSASKASTNPSTTKNISFHTHPIHDLSNVTNAAKTIVAEELCFFTLNKHICQDRKRNLSTAVNVHESSTVQHF
jgi:hypothetical protein